MNLTEEQEKLLNNNRKEILRLIIETEIIIQHEIIGISIIKADSQVSLRKQFIVDIKFNLEDL